MDQINKLVKYNTLFEIYGKLLSNKQEKILNDYFCFNLSISEIALEENISRAAVEDAIKKGCAKLDKYENTFSFSTKREKIIEILNDSKVDKKIIAEIEKELF